MYLQSLSKEGGTNVVEEGTDDCCVTDVLIIADEPTCVDRWTCNCTVICLIWVIPEAINSNGTYCRRRHDKRDTLKGNS